MVEQTDTETRTSPTVQITGQPEPVERPAPDRDPREYGPLYSLVGTLIVLGWLVLSLVLRNSF